MARVVGRCVIASTCTCVILMSGLVEVKSCFTCFVNDMVRIGHFKQIKCFSKISSDEQFTTFATFTTFAPEKTLIYVCSWWKQARNKYALKKWRNLQSPILHFTTSLLFFFIQTVMTRHPNHLPLIEAAVFTLWLHISNVMHWNSWGSGGCASNWSILNTYSSFEHLYVWMWYD